MYIKVKVHTESKKESLKQLAGDKFECFVKEKAERNMANIKVLELLAEYLGIEIGKLRIVSGHHSPNKIIEVR